MKVVTVKRAIISLDGKILKFYAEDFSSRWANKYAIRAELITNKLKDPTRSYGAVYRLYELLNKLNVKCYC